MTDTTLLKQSTVLFVDDEPQVTSGFQRALRREPYTIVTASSGQAGLAVLASRPVDVVVSDERMPGMKGSDFLTAVCRQYPETIRIMLTGQASLEAAIHAINDGEIYRFLTKPCNPLVLGHTIRQALQVKHLAQHSSRLLATAREQQAVLRELEKTHPGITAVHQADDGVIVVEEPDGDIDTLLQEIVNEVADWERRHDP